MRLRPLLRVPQLTVSAACFPAWNLQITSSFPSAPLPHAPALRLDRDSLYTCVQVESVSN